MNVETEKVYRKLEEVIGICSIKNNKKGKSFNQEILSMLLSGSPTSIGYA